MGKTARVIATFLISVVIGVMTIWASLAIYYSNLPGPHLRSVVACTFAIAVLVSFLFLPRRGRTLLGFLVLFLLIVVWWTVIPASNDRDWQDDVAILPYATIQNDLVTIHNIRNLNYRTETDFDVHYYDKTFDLNTLESVDLIAVYWMGDAIAHIMVSFGFQGKDYVDFSIETRKEKGEGYSTIKGFFKQYELIYIAGDERDLIRVRTDYRNPQEEVYLFRTKSNRERARRLLMEYVRQINAMKEKPVWYNTLTTNCTTNIVMHIKTFSDHIRYNWKILLSGYTPLYAYERGALDTRMPFGELKKRSYINPRAHLIGNDPEFSRKIREGLPLPGR
jgi:Ca2+/Na+ antiporter